MTELALPALGAFFVNPRDGRQFASAATKSRDEVDASLRRTLSANGDVLVAVARTETDTLLPRLKALYDQSGMQTATVVLPFLAFLAIYPFASKALGVDIFMRRGDPVTFHTVLTGAFAAVGLVSMLAFVLGVLVFFSDFAVDKRSGRFAWASIGGTAWADIVTWTATALAIGEKRLYVVQPCDSPDGTRVTEICYDAIGKVEILEGRIDITDRRGESLFSMPSPRLVTDVPGNAGRPGDSEWLLDTLRGSIPA